MATTYPNITGTPNHEVDPISRIEGHLGIAVHVDGSGKIDDAYAHGNLWRGFENFLLGREANDAITFVQRICGVCPVPHGLTSTYAVDAVLGYSEGHITFADDSGFGVPKKAVLIRNLVLGVEFLMSSITHFYHLAAPSYVQGPNMPPWTPYFANAYYHPLLQNPLAGSGAGLVPNIANGFSNDLWSAVINSYVKALRIRRLTFEAGALFAGRMPMTSVYVGGGVTFDKTEDVKVRCGKFKTIVEEVVQFVLQEYVPIVLALGALYPNWDNQTNANWLRTNGNPLWTLMNPGNPAADATNTGYGAGLGRFLAWGAFPDTTATGGLTIAGGVKFTPADVAAGKVSFTVVNKAQVKSVWLDATNGVSAKLTEDISHSRYGVSTLDSAAYGSTSGYTAYPGAVSRTKPYRDKPGAYTYMKAPRWDGLPCEVGPMARMFVSGKFVAGDALSANISAYSLYVKGTGLNAGLEPKMVSADIAVALVRASAATGINIAKLTKLSDGTPVSLGSGSQADIIAAYSGADTVITGALTSWILALVAGNSTMDRLRGRGLESVVLGLAIAGTPSLTSGAWNVSTGAFNFGWDAVGSGSGWIDELWGTTGDTWKQKSIPTGTAQGWGATEAPRGALMHQCEITNGKITKYQCIVPTTWNGSPVDHNNQHGAMEAAVIGVPFTAQHRNTGVNGDVDSVGGVEVLRVAQSFDPCIACAIH